MSSAPVVKLSAIDEMRFGVRTAKAQPETLEDIQTIEQFCGQNQVDFVIARVPVAKLNVVRAMESLHYQLMDTLLYFSFDFTRIPIPDSGSSHQVRPVDRASEAQSVRAIASASFHDYSGHYHADQRLDREACDEVYRSWAENSVLSPDVAHEVLVVDDCGVLLGFITLRIETPDTGHIVLAAVAPEAQRKGVYQALLVHGMHWCRQQGATRVITSTQITNKASPKAWTRLGFDFDHAYYTFHKWF